MSVSIPSTFIKDSTAFYHISIKLPLRLVTVDRRYSEFEELVKNLCKDLGISAGDFSYSLPAKKLKWMSNNASTVESRRQDLERFLNCVIRDTELQNSPILLRFLNLPVNFKFSKQLFQPKVTNLHADLSSIDELNWLEIVRNFKTEVSLLQEKKSSFQEKVQDREKITKTLQPCLSNLNTALQNFKLDSKERARRLSVIEGLKRDLDDLVQNSFKTEVPNNNFTNRRVLGKPKETKETLQLNDSELLQQQVQIQKDQDQELDELLKIVQRQRQIGEAINMEVEEQNEMIDELENDTHVTSDKLRMARMNAKKIL